METYESSPRDPETLLAAATGVRMFGNGRSQLEFLPDRLDADQIVEVAQYLIDATDQLASEERIARQGGHLPNPHLELLDEYSDAMFAVLGNLPQTDIDKA